MALYSIIHLGNLDLQNKPMHIFTHRLNSLCLLSTQIKYPTIQNNHLYKTIISKIVQMLQILQILQRRQHPTSIKILSAHANIQGNKIADTLAKEGRHKDHRHPSRPFEFAHATPCTFIKSV